MDCWRPPDPGEDTGRWLGPAIVAGVGLWIAGSLAVLFVILVILP